MAREDNIATQTRMIKAVNAGELDALRAIFAEGVFDHDAAADQAQGAEGFIQFFRTFREGFPDLQVTIDHMFADDEHIAIAVTVTGTNTGRFVGQPPTGNRIRIRGMQIARFNQQGQIVERWGSSDELGLRAQLSAE